MAGYFTIGETKLRPGAYFNVQAKGSGVTPGAVDGVVAILFRAKMGPMGVATVISASDDYTKIFGDGGTTDAIREAIYGGASKIVGVRIGTGGTAGSVELTAATGKLVVTAKSVGAESYSVTVRAKLTDSSVKEIIFYRGTQQIEIFEFAAAGDEVAAAVAACAKSEYFTVTASADPAGAGVITNVSQSALTGGADPTVANAQYSDGLTALEPYFFNVLAIDTEESSVQALVQAFLSRIYRNGSFGFSVFAPAVGLTKAQRNAAAAAFNGENIVYVINPDVSTAYGDLYGYQVAAYFAGLIAAKPANQSIMHTVIAHYTDLKDRYTPSEIEAAEAAGGLVLEVNSNDQVWTDNAITTLVTPDADQDDGWKKIRRTKTRYELLYRGNQAADALAGKVDNDNNGRMTIMAAIQRVGDAMIGEGKLNACTVTPTTKVVTDGDTCGFDIDVIDKDSAEHIYLIYYFQFSTNVE